MSVRGTCFGCVKKVWVINTKSVFSMGAYIRAPKNLRHTCHTHLINTLVGLFVVVFVFVFVGDLDLDLLRLCLGIDDDDDDNNTVC